MQKDRFYIPISMSKERHEQIFGKDKQKEIKITGCIKRQP